MTLQVVAITIAPSVDSTFVEGTVHSIASVTGTTQTGVSFAIREGAQGGGLAQTGVNTAMYTAPGQPGTFQVVATSLADRTKRASATITVRLKVRDGKGVKERKEFVKEREQPKLIVENKLRDGPITRGLGGESPAEEPGKGGGRSGSEASGQTAFIKPEERPPVGEPQRRAHTPTRRKSKRKPKSG
jgi:hypothetical protein